MMRSALLLLAGLAVLSAAGPVSAASKATKASAQAAASASIERGKLVFARNCAPCHGQGPGDDGSPTLPGTARLEARYKGEKPAALELRDDLTAPVLRLFVRSGLGAMPMFRKAEVSDADIDAIAAYIAAGNRETKR